MESARCLLEDYLIINLSKLSIHFIFDGRRQKNNKMILKKFTTYLRGKYANNRNKIDIVRFYEYYIIINMTI